MAGGGGNTTTLPEEKGSDGGCRLPEDIIMEILKRLRTGCCIGRSRCVNKSWYRMLSDPNFIGKIIFFSNTDDEEAAKIMLTDRRINQVNNDGRITYSVLSSSTWSCSSSGFIFPDLNRNPEIVGCCDGIFCIYEKMIVGDPPIYFRITLWNPTTGETKVLPVPDVPHPNDLYQSQIQVGFGFDPQTKDYKVIAGFSCFGCLYSLRNDSWRRLESWINTPNARYLCNVTQLHSSRMDKVYWVWRPISEWRFVYTDYFYINYFDMTKEVPSTEIECLSYPGPYYLIVAGTFTVVKESLIVITYGEELLDLPPPTRIRCEDSSSDEEDNIYYNKSGKYTVYTIWGMLGSEQLNFGSCKWTKLFTVNLQYPFKAISGVWVHGRCFVVDTEQRLHINESVSPESTHLVNITGQCSSACQVTSFVPSAISLSSSSP